MKKSKLKISLLLGTILMPVVSYGSAGFLSTGFGSADFDRVDAQFAGVIVSDEALFSAIKSGNRGLVNYLLDHGANVNALVKETDNKPGRQWWYYWRTPLTKAIWTKNIDLVRLLLERGADVNARLEYIQKGMESGIFFTRYSCPLISAIAIATNNSSIGIEMVRLLLAWGANVNTEGGATLVPLIVAAPWNPEIVQLLLEQKGIDINATHNTNISWDEYESRAYAREPYDIQVPITALRNAGELSGQYSKAAQSVQLLLAHGAHW
jgi:ankyrin repeat protein